MNGDLYQAAEQEDQAAVKDLADGELYSWVSYNDNFLEEYWQQQNMEYSKLQVPVPEPTPGEAFWATAGAVQRQACSTSSCSSMCTILETRRLR